MFTQSTLQSPQFLRRVLWLDLLTGVATGLLQLSMPDQLAAQFGLPAALVRGSGAGLFAFVLLIAFLLTQRSVPAPFLRLLVVSNWLWVVACLWVASGAALPISTLGQVNLVVQAAFVAGLATLQGRCLRRLAT